MKDYTPNYPDREMVVVWSWTEESYRLRQVQGFFTWDEDTKTGSEGYLWIPELGFSMPDKNYDVDFNRAYRKMEQAAYCERQKIVARLNKIDGVLSANSPELIVGQPTIQRHLQIGS